MIAPAADELPQKGAGGHKSGVHSGKSPEGLHHLVELLPAGIVGVQMVQRLRKRGGIVGKQGDLVAQGRVDDDVRSVLEGGNIAFFAPADVVPHGQGGGHVGAPEIQVPHRPAGDAHPGALEPQLLPIQNVGAGGDVEGGGFGMASGDVVVEGVDALENGDLIGPQGEGPPPGVVAHLAGKLKLGDNDFLPPGELGKSLIQQIHVQQQGRFQIDVTLRRAGRGGAVHGLEVVIQRDGVGGDPPAFQFLLQLEGGGGLAGAGGAGEQHDGTLVPPLEDGVGGLGNALLILLVALGQEGGWIVAEGLPDLLELIGQGSHSFRWARKAAVFSLMERSFSRLWRYS